MATHVWQGDAIAVAKVMRATPANVEVDDVFTLVCGGFSVAFTATAATVANVCTGLVAAWNTSTDPTLTEITAADDTTHITLTGDTAGNDFLVTSTAVDGGGTDDQTMAMTTPTACVSPNMWTAANFDSGTLPANTDTVIIEHSDVDIKYGLDQSAVTLAALVIKQSYTGNIGLDRTASAAAHDAGTAAYVEYRGASGSPGYLAISATAVDIGEGEGTGASQIKLDFGSNQTTVNVHATGTSGDVARPACLLKGTHASNAINVQGGDVGLAIYGGETSTVATLQVGYTTSQGADSYVTAGDGMTLTTVNISGGTVELQDNVTTVTQTAGTLTLRDTATCGTLNLDGGMCYHESSGTLTTANVGGGGTLDFRRDMRSRTVTNCNAYQGCSIHDPEKTVTWTNGIDLVRCSPDEVGLNIGQHQTITPSSI